MSSVRQVPSITINPISLVPGYQEQQYYLTLPMVVSFNELQKKRGPFVAAPAMAYLMNLDIGFSKDGTEGIFWALRFNREIPKP